jgi:MYXO-CTERM domain-containing protein
MPKVMIKLVLAMVALVAGTQTAAAFCGFYVSPGEQPLLADATQVVLMRSGTRTVLSMQNNYKGPPSSFAMVIPVPVVLKEADVKTLTKQVFDNVERMGAPRLVEYWEQDPCGRDEERYDRLSAAPTGMSAPMKKSKAADDLGVTVEAQFEVGEYQIVILSAKESTGLDTWLRREKYNIPKGAEPLLRPYVESGMKFFVAKVDIKKVQFVNGRAELSPLRFHYDSAEFVLPIRLGLANSSGTQDLIVNILAPNQRYQVANYNNVTIPTNIDVKPDVKPRFGAFYASLFDRTIEKNPGAVVTEYAWQATTCDPCPGPALNYRDFMLLGSDVLDGSQEIATGSNPPASSPPRPPMRRRVPPGYGMNFVLTRLHARYGKDLSEDLVFKEAPAIVGGREHVIDPQTHALEQGAQESSINNFQGRYAIRYPWTGAVDCPNPRRGIWGGPPGGGMPRPQPAMDLAFAPRGEVKLAAAVVPTDLPEIGLKGGVLEAYAKPAPAPERLPAAPRGERGCGCRTNDPAGALVLLALVGLIWRRKRT